MNVATQITNLRNLANTIASGKYEWVAGRMMQERGGDEAPRYCALGMMAADYCERHGIDQFEEFVTDFGRYTVMLREYGLSQLDARAIMQFNDQNIVWKVPASPKGRQFTYEELNTLPAIELVSALFHAYADALVRAEAHAISKARTTDDMLRDALTPAVEAPTAPAPEPVTPNPFVGGKAYGEYVPISTPLAPTPIWHVGQPTWYGTLSSGKVTTTFTPNLPKITVSATAKASTAKI